MLEIWNVFSKYWILKNEQKANYFQRLGVSIRFYPFTVSPEVLILGRYTGKLELWKMKYEAKTFNYY